MIVRKIAIAGGPGSGKSSLARQIVTELYNRRLINAQLVTEVAREYINLRNFHNGTSNYTLADNIYLYREQAEREDSTPGDVVITDSPLFLAFVYMFRGINECGRPMDFKIAFSILEDYFRRDPYDLVLFLNRERPLLDDGTREQDEEESDKLGEMIRSFLDLFDIPYKVVSGDDDQRLSQSLDYIDEFFPILNDLSEKDTPSQSVQVNEVVIVERNTPTNRGKLAERLGFPDVETMMTRYNRGDFDDTLMESEIATAIWLDTGKTK